MTLEASNLARALSIRGEVRVLVGDVSLRVAPGEVIGITGPSGCGKSTLLRLLMGLDAKSAGTVSLDGAEVAPSDLPEFRRKVAMLAQDVSTPAGTPRTTFDPDRTDGAPPDGELETNLTALGLTSSALDTPWEKLSGGEARRVRLALLAAASPRFLVLDEPSSGLDGDNVVRLAAFIRAQAAAGLGILVVSHDELLLARCASRLQILYEGTVQGEGTPEEIIPAACAEVRREATS